MDRSRTPAIIAGILVVAAIVVFFVVRDSDDDSSTATTPTEATVTETTLPEDPGGGVDQGGGGGDETKPEEPKPEIETIVVKNGQPVGGVAELTFTEGDDIRFRVESDVAEEVHLHGYNVSQDVEAGGSVEFDVPATITGVFEAELEHSVVPIAEITVNPA